MDNNTNNNTTIKMKESEILEVAKKLAYKYARMMYGRHGIEVFAALANGTNLAYSLEDMSQDIALAIVEHCKCSNNCYIITEKNYRCLYKVVNHAVYEQKRNNTHKNLYINIDGNEVAITDLLGMTKLIDEDTRWMALLIYDSLIDSINYIHPLANVTKDKLKVYGYQRLIEGRIIKDCDYSYCDVWLKRHRKDFDI